MSETRTGKFICDECGKFCRPVDDWTPFGCSNYDPPEPHEPRHVCKRCWRKFRDDWVRAFKAGNHCGDWQKSRAEREAATKCGLVWIHGEGFPKGADWREQVLYRWVTKGEFEANKLDKPPVRFDFSKALKKAQERIW